MQVPEEINSWLCGLGLVPPSEGRKVGEDKISLSKATTMSVETGALFAKIVKKLQKQKAESEGRLETPFPALDSLKEQINTPAARVYNWGILSESFKQLGI